MLDPEIADGFVGVAQRKAVGGLGVRKVSWIEVHAQVVGLGPIDPALEVLGLDLVAVDVRPAVIEVAGVKIEAMVAGDDAERLLDVAPQLGDGASLPGIVAGGLNAAARQLRACGFESAHVIALPAMHGDRNSFEPLHCGIRVHSQCRVFLFSDLVCRIDGLICHCFLLVAPVGPENPPSEQTTSNGGWTRAAPGLRPRPVREENRSAAPEPAASGWSRLSAFHLAGAELPRGFRRPSRRSRSAHPQQGGAPDVVNGSRGVCQRRRVVRYEERRI